MPGEQEWQGPAELWEVSWRPHYQVVAVEYVRRPLRSGEDPRSYPQTEDYRRCDSHTVGTLEGLEDFLSGYGKLLADVEQIFPLCPPLPACG